MKNPSNEIRIEYVAKLTGTVTVNTKVVKIFDGKAWDGQTKPYVILTIPKFRPEGRNKDLLIYEDFEVQLDIISDYNGQKEVDEIEQKILDIICPNDYLSTLNLNSFYAGYTTFSSDNLPILETATGVISRKILIISHFLTEK